jgi:hypothetical protein
LLPLHQAVKISLEIKDYAFGIIKPWFHKLKAGFGGGMKQKATTGGY